MRTMVRKIIFLFALALSALPGASFAATDELFEISGWIPYWRGTAGVESILPHVDTFTEVNPFVYTVKLNGELNEASLLTDAQWVNLAGQTKAKGIRFIPTVMWANPDAIDEVLRDPLKRQEHVRAIVREVYARKFDGIDIDYEGKYARTKPYFSLFLQELYVAMEFDKWIMCTIEARTPLDSRYSSPESIPKDIEYANDFVEINKYCDRVRIMAYDQGRIDLKLNKSNADPYVPVADKAWVEKVILLAAKDIDKSKIVIGVPTYGYEYDMFNALDGSGEIEYSNLWSFNPGYATDTALKLQIAPMRNSAGELFLTYPASRSLDPSIPLPFATRVMSWSDAEAIRQKAELAEKLGVRGIALFKIDGGQDAGLWNVLAQYKNKSMAFVPATISVNTTDTSVINVSGKPGVVAPSRNLYFGIIGEDVRTLQKFLNERGFSVSTTGGGSPGNETKYFGPATVRALTLFQKAHNITPAVGYFGPKTRAAIQLL